MSIHKGKQKKLLLILPRLQQERDREYRLIKYSRFPPLSLLTLAGLTPADDWQIIIRDEHLESGIVDEDVDLVGVQTYISSAYRAYELATLYRKRGAKVVLGGLHPTSLPDESAGYADSVCIGPAETVWRDILHDFNSGSLKKFYRGKCDGSASMVPLPRRDLINQRLYLIMNTMVTSRGCPNACSFCYKSGFWGKSYYEARPIAQLERELDTVEDGLVFFLDDNLLGNKPHARRLFDALRGSGIVWQAAASLDAARDPGYLDEAYAAGCRSLFVGFETISLANIGQAHKHVNTTIDYGTAIRRFHDAGIMINSSFAFGFDHDGPDVFDRTVEFTIENRLETATFHILTPFPGTQFFEQLESQGRLMHRNWSRYDTDHAVFLPALMTPEQLEEGHQRAYREFLSYGSILRRSLGMPGALKRIMYNVAWMKVDPLWVAIVRTGLMPFARQVLNRVLWLNTKLAQRHRAEPEVLHFPGERRHELQKTGS
ncbi:MAG: cobalamin-dependent protein [Pseudomonadota bacterium]